MRTRSACAAALWLWGTALGQGPGLGPLAEPEAGPRPDGTAPSAQNNALEGEMTPELDASVTRGLSALARMQNTDGSFGDSRWGRSVAITSLACLAFMADGHLPGRGAYGEVIVRGLDFVLANVADNGLIAAESANGPMYGHGFATLFLGEVYGMTQGQDTARDARIHEALVKAVRLIEQTQNDEGGWRYNPVPYDADSSVTICQIMALRSARNAGLEVSKETIDRAVEYIRRCQNPDGGFKYQLSGGPSAWPRSAAGVATFYYAGVYEDQAVERGLEYLLVDAAPQRTDPNRAHYFYGHYYAVQAMYLAGGEWWARWWPEIRQRLIVMQREDGSWPDSTVGDAYGTAMALIVLQMPKRYLPIFQK
jgi:hypothetical protein